MVMKVALNNHLAKQPLADWFTPYKAHHSIYPSPFARFARRSPPPTLCVSRNHYPSSSERFSEHRLPEQSQDFDFYSDSSLALHSPSFRNEGLTDISSMPRCISGLPCSSSESLFPSLLGINPNPPSWPERDEIVKISIEKRANRTDIPLSIRIIKMRQRQIRKGSGLIDEANESMNCSMGRAFSSFALIVRELGTCAVQLTERRLSVDESKEIVGKAHREINDSLVWIFGKVFAQTPNLMIYVMILLANFSVHSMAHGCAVVAPPTISLFETIIEDENQDESQGFIRRENSPGLLGLSGEEKVIWGVIVEEVGKMRGEVLNQEMMRWFVAPVTVKVDVGEHEEHLRTDLAYQMNLSQDPENPLLLCNYARFLSNISRNYDRAEEYFKRATQMENPDAESLSQYADFLYMVRKDMWGAEERYQQAISIEPNNPFYASKYASFLWNTGGDETCFPLDPPDESHGTEKLPLEDEYS